MTYKKDIVSGKRKQSKISDYFESESEEGSLSEPDARLWKEIKLFNLKAIDDKDFDKSLKVWTTKVVRAD